MRTKQCSRCGQSFAATAEFFAPNLRYADGLMLECRPCRLVVLQERKERKKAVSREWAANNREKARQSVKRSYARHRRSRQEYYRRYRQENKERLNEYSREYGKRKRQEAQHE